MSGDVLIKGSGIHFFSYYHYGEDRTISRHFLDFILDPVFKIYLIHIAVSAHGRNNGKVLNTGQYHCLKY